MADKYTEDAEVELQMQLRKLIWDARKSMDTVNIVSHSIEKILRRGEANILINELAKKSDYHGVDLIINNMFMIVGNHYMFKDSAEVNGVFDEKNKDREYLSIQHSSLNLSDSGSFEKEVNRTHLHPEKKRVTIGIPEILVERIDDSFRPDDKSPLTPNIAHSLFHDDEEDEPYAAPITIQNDWRADRAPPKPKHDSFFSNAVPVTENVKIDFSSFSHKKTLNEYGLSPAVRSKKSYIRMGSARSSKSVLKKQFEKANNHLNSKFVENIRQKRLTEYENPGDDDPNIERMRLMKQRDALR